MIERKIKNAPVGQGTVRMLTREEWEEFREVRPRTPFESKLARPNARIRTEETVRMVRHPVLFVTTSLCSLADKRISITGMTVKIGSAFVHIFYPLISESIRRGYGIIVSCRPLFSLWMLHLPDFFVLDTMNSNAAFIRGCPICSGRTVGRCILMLQSLFSCILL